MNKFLTKVAKIFLGLSMAAGVGVAVGAGRKDTAKVFATSGTMITSFSATSGDYDDNITYTSYKGGGTSNPAVNSNQIRLYQGTTTNAGGMLVIEAKTGYTISAITVGSGMATTLGYKVGTKYSQSTAVSNFTNWGSCSNGGTKELTGLSTTVVTFACLGTSSSSRWYVNKLSVTYSGGATDSVTVTLNTNSLSIDLYTSKTASLTATAATTGTATAGLSAASSNTSVATVGTASPTSGTAFTITGVTVGSATITVTSTWDNNKKATCTVTVTDSTPTGDIEIVFGPSGTDSTSDMGGSFDLTYLTKGGEYVTSATGSKLYKDTRGLKFGNSSNPGTVTFTFDSTKKSALAGTTLYATILRYGSDNGTFDFTCASLSGSPVSKTPTGTATEVKIGSISSTAPSELTIATSEKRGYVAGLRFELPSTDPDVSIDKDSLSLGSGGPASTIEATPNEYLSDPVYTWAIKSGSDDCVTLSSSTNVATVTPKTLSGIVGNATITLRVTSSSDNTVDIQKEIPVTVTRESSSSSPYTVADAKAAVDANIGKTGAYVQGIISQIDSYSSNAITYWISDDGQTTNQLEVYSGKGLNGANFTSKDNLVVGQHVVVTGNLTLYNSSVYEFSSGSSIYSFDSHTVTYDANGGTVSPSSEIVTCGSTGTLPTPTWSGYTFDGWKKNGTGSAIAAGQPTERIVANTTYVAQWSQILTLDSITIDTTDVQKTFTKNGAFNHDNLVVTAHYEEEGAQSKDVSTLATVQTPDLTSIGDKTVTVSYTENGITKTNSYTIHVNGIISGITTDMPASLNLDLGESSDQYTATIEKDSDVTASVVWATSDNTVATVSNGTITAAAGKTGTATITVFADANADGEWNEGEYKSTCTVKVVDPNALTDTLTREDTGVASGSTSYTNWSGVTDSTSAVYAGTSAGNFDSIQLNSGSGYIVNTASAGYVRTIVITYNDNTSSSSRKVSVYGNASKFESKAEISSNGTLLGEVTYDGSTASYTININAEYEYEYFGIIANNALYLDSIEITYEKIDTSPSIQLIGNTIINGKEDTTDNTSLKVKVKNIDSPVFSFTYEEDGNTGITSNYISVSAGTPTDKVYPLIINLNNEGTSIVHLDVSGQTASFTVTVLEVAYVSANLPAQYRLVTDASTLTAGDKILIADNHTNNDYDRVMNGTLTSGYFGVSNVTFTGAGITNANVSDGLVLTLGGSSGAWTLQKENGDYVTANSSKNFVVSNTSGTWTIDISNGNATITYSNSSYGYILHNVNSSRYKPYTSDPNVSMRLPQIYRYISGEQNVEIDTDILDAISSAKSTFSCNAQGLSFDGESFNNMSLYFTEVIKSKYFLDYATSNSSGNIVEQWLSMYDYAVEKYGEDYDFLGRIASGKIVRSQHTNLLNILNGKSTNKVAIIVIISMVSVTAIGGYFFLRKRKENI